MISDHVAMTPDVRQRYPEPFYDPFTTLAWLAGHLGGLVTGAIVAGALAYAPRKRRNLVVGGTVAALLLFMAALVVIQTIALRSTPVPVGF